MPTFNATSTAVQELIELLPNVASALSTAGSALNKADSLDTEILDIKTNRLPSLETGINTVNAKADDIELKRLQNEFDNAAKFDTWDTKLQNEVSKIDNVAADVADIKPKTSRILNWLGTALDAIDIVGFVLDLAQTAALSAAIATVGQNSLNRDNALQALIDQLTANLQALETMIAAQLNDIQSTLNGYNDDFSALLARTLQIATILSQTTAILDYVEDLPNNFNSLTNQLNQLSQNDTVIIDYVEDLPALQDSVNTIIPAIPSKVCEALNSDCWDKLVDCGADLSSIENGLQEILNKLGIFPYNCQTVQPSNGVFDTVSEALQALTCGGIAGFGNGTKIDIDGDGVSDNLKEDLDYVINSVKRYIANHLVDCRQSFDSLAYSLNVLIPSNLKFLNEVKKQQLLMFDAIDLVSEDLEVVIPSETIDNVLERVDYQGALTNSRAKIETDLEAMDASLITAENDLKETRLESEATFSITALPYEHLEGLAPPPIENH